VSLLFEPATREEYLQSFVGKKVKLCESVLDVEAGEIGLVKDVMPFTRCLSVYYEGREPLLLVPEEFKLCEE
jgi:hypothetical protein